MEEAGVPGENHGPWAGNWQTLSRAMRVELNLFLYGTKSCCIGDRLQWSTQVSLNQQPGPLSQREILKAELIYRNCRQIWFSLKCPLTIILFENF